MTDDAAQRIFGTPGAMALAVVAILAAFLTAAAWSDLRRRRIPNLLVLSGSLLALLLHSVLPAGDGFLSALPGGLGVIGALQGFAFGLIVMLPLYALRAMGAGDVKLLAMVGAFLGPVEIWWALFFTLIAGGVLAMAVMLQRALLGSLLHNLDLIFWNLLSAINPIGRKGTSGGTFVSAAPLPYAVAIAAGSIAAAIYRTPLFDLF